MLGIANNVYACAWMVVVLFFSSWPAFTPVTPQTMNYSVFITVFVAGCSGVYYWVRGRREYKGPVVEVVLPS